MARFSVGFTSKTMTAVADTTAMTDNGYATFIQGRNSTMQLRVNEIYIGGESANSVPTTMVFGRDSTVAATSISGNVMAVMDASSTVTPGTTDPIYGCVSTTKPQRSATLGRLLDLSLNAFGGISRWQARFGEEITTVGNTASLGEVSLSSVTGAGIVSGHVILECV